MGDLIYCEVMQGIRSPSARSQVSSLLLSLPQFDLVGFTMAQKSAANYRLLRSRGVTVRKTIDVLIGTFCAEHGFQLVHNDVDFDHMAAHVGLGVV
jgi:predicted nucleic acid-binding protein